MGEVAMHVAVADSLVQDVTFCMTIPWERHHGGTLA